MQPTIKVGTRTLRCRIAYDHTRGLQAPEPPLAEGEGMLFLFTPPRAATFHMGAVSYPIDIVFVEDGRVAKIVRNAKPGTPERWSHNRTGAVLEVRAGDARDIEVGNNIRFPLEPYDVRTEQTVNPEDRYEDRALPPDADSNADQMSVKYWDQQLGHDPMHEGPPIRTGQAMPQVNDPADFIVGIIQAMDNEARPLDWHRDVLNPSLQYAVINQGDVVRWLQHYKLSASEMTDVAQFATSVQGMSLLGDGLIIAGLADQAVNSTSEYGENVLVLWAQYER